MGCYLDHGYLEPFGVRFRGGTGAAAARCDAAGACSACGKSGRLGRATGLNESGAAAAAAAPAVNPSLVFSYHPLPRAHVSAPRWQVLAKAARRGRVYGQFHSFIATGTEPGLASSSSSSIGEPSTAKRLDGPMAGRFSGAGGRFPIRHGPGRLATELIHPP